jgi:hypothetical protein
MRVYARSRTEPILLLNFVQSYCGFGMDCYFTRQTGAFRQIRTGEVKEDVNARGYDSK